MATPTSQQGQLEIDRGQVFWATKTAKNNEIIGNVKTNGNPISYEIEQDSSGGAFDVHHTDGVIYIKDAALLKNDKFVLQIKVEDNAGNQDSKDININIYYINNGQVFSIPETAKRNDLVGTIKATPTNVPASFSIVSGNGQGVFDIPYPGTGKINVVKEQLLSYDNNTSYKLVIGAVASNNSFTQESIDINVWRIDFFPEINTEETDRGGKEIGRVTVSGARPNSFRFIEQGLPFEIDNDGVIKTKRNVPLSYQKKSSYELTVEATVDKLSSTRKIKINLIFDKRVYDRLAVDANSNKPILTKEQLLDFPVPSTTESAQALIERHLGQISETLKNRP